MAKVYSMAKKQEIKKVVICIPSEGHTLPEAYDNHLMMATKTGGWEVDMKYKKRNPRYEFYWYTVGRLLTPLAREKAIEEALKGEADYLIMYDDDMVLPLDMIQALLFDMEEHPEIDVLAPLAFMRNPPHFAVMYNVEEGYDPVRHQEYYINQFVKNYPRNKLVECEAVGFGAVCIRMSLIKKLKAPYCFSTANTGEDIWFCVKARKEAKARIFMDTRIKLGHLANPKVIDEAYFDKYIKDNKIKLPEMPDRYKEVEA